MQVTTSANENSSQNSQAGLKVFVRLGSGSGALPFLSAFIGVYLRLNDVDLLNSPKTLRNYALASTLEELQLAADKRR
jgi:hypothetical protein